MDDKKAAQTLQDVRLWALDKIHSGTEMPWSWYQYMKLVETIESIQAGFNASITMEDLQQSLGQEATGLRLVEKAYRQDNAQHHQVGIPVNLPM